MPQYRVIAQKHIAAGAKTRDFRSTERQNFEIVDIAATSLSNAVLKATIQFGRSNYLPRIVSAEEMLDVDPSEITDEEITRAITVSVHGNTPLDRDDYDGAHSIDEDFEDTVQKVAHALNDSGLVPGLNVSLLLAKDGCLDYSMVEIQDNGSGGYRSVGREPKRLSTDWHLTGWDSVLSIARALIEIVASEKLL